MVGHVMQLGRIVTEGVMGKPLVQWSNSVTKAKVGDTSALANYLGKSM